MFALTQYTPSSLTKIAGDTTRPKATRVLAKAAERLAVWTVRSRSRAVLKHLTSDQLADLGLSRAEAQEEAAKWFWKS